MADSSTSAPQVVNKGGPKTGPLAGDEATDILVTADVHALAKNLTLDGGDFQVITPVEEIRGLLAPFSNRARHILVSLLRGYSIRMAAANVGLTDETVRLWGKKAPEFAQAVQRASNLGFSRTFERELHSRAMAGTDDRGSMRALEMVVKARAPEYREKQQVHMEVVHRAEQALGGMVQGWEQNEALDS